MKSMKKFLALALALALCFVMAIPALATENPVKTSSAGVETQAAHKTPNGLTNCNIDFSTATPGHIYYVYQLYAGDLDENGKLSNVVYGVNYPGKTTEQKVPQNELDQLHEMQNDSKEIVEWANARKAEILAVSPAMQPVGVFADDNKNVNQLPSGYYLVVDMSAAQAPDGEEVVNDAMSAIMLQVVGDVDITAKVTVPSIDKQVKLEEDDDTKYTETVDTEIGKAVTFKVSATVPTAELLKYAMTGDASKDVYELVLHDKMSAGLTYKGPISVTCTTSGDPKTLEKDTNYTETVNGQEITISISNLFDIITTDKTKWSDDKIVVTATYSATLNEDAIVSDSGSSDKTNFNSAYLEYSNNPGSSGKGKTPPDETYVYTFKLKIEKYENDVNTPHTGKEAGFTLYPSTIVPATEEGGEPTYNDATEALKFKQVNGKYVRDDAGTITEIKTDENGYISFEGLKAGTYKLVETSVPTGFNKCADRHITITATHNDDKNDGAPQLTLTVTQKEVAGSTGEGNNGTVDNESGSTLKIINKSGTLLPSTGGIGTTIFYAVGGALVVGAGVLLFVRKRMGSKG